MTLISGLSSPLALYCALGLSTCLIWFVPGASQAEESADNLPPAVKRHVDFTGDVQPILAKHCIRCHGPDHAESGLRLHLRASALKGGDSGAVMEIKNSRKSLLIQRVAAKDENERMPPKDEGEPLSAEQVGILRAWIDGGANWPDEPVDSLKQAQHWSFKKPVRPELPALANATWPRNHIDHFVFVRFEDEELQPSPEADRYTLIRRLSLDLIGLPPSPEEVAAFIHDDRPDAYEQLVDRLLASPHYGEHWGRMWLDLVRYADSTGYSDYLRLNIWPYRDWVIDAFNRNLPFDQFTIEQIAGDLLPKPTSRQLLATAMHRNTMTNTEAGTDNEEFRVAAVKDRSNVTMQVWMGLTMGCAECHSHKYDPISQREYYQIYAFFNQSQDANRQESPLVSIVPPSRQQRWVEVQQRKDAVERQLVEPIPALDQRQAQVEEALFAAKTTICSWIVPSHNSASVQEAASDGHELYRVCMRLLRVQLVELVEQHADRLRAIVLAVYRQSAPELRGVFRERIQLGRELAAIPVETPILRELPLENRRRTHVLKKGNFLAPGDLVEPAVPAAFHPLPADTRADRLGLARWLVDRENPLTARVLVNRIWSQLFGAGIVETEEDFGTKGALPSHPEVLDWLAVEFMDRGWDMKALLRTIVTSATYRQSSRVTPALLSKDPRNRLLARAPRFRLAAETIRDQALSLSGLLSRNLGGPSVYPPQPDGVWRSTELSNWRTSQGDDRYRRGLYTFWKRTSPYPSMLIFDAPNRETCTMRRVRTNTPLQALVTLNDPVFVEAAQALALRVIHEGGEASEKRARFALQLCLVRPPRNDEVSVVLDLLEKQLNRYAADREAALKVIDGLSERVRSEASPAELAAWRSIASVLLNHDAVLTRN